MAAARRVPQAEALSLATLVLSTIGTALGGPVGSAIGALIGQSIDQQLLAPARRGPRVGDLSVQSSSYGTQIPRVYGTMRVAGSVIWSTDLIEQEQTAGGKGQPDVTFSYTVSLAVALSSRPAKSVKRIWADGKLLRGAEGDFKVGTIFRFYGGTEDQPIDPLIGSLEGISNTPAYRGLALAIFENLELAEFGNRIPFLTFEFEGDEETPTLGSVLTDSAQETISCDDAQPLLGFAAYGGSIRSAIEPLVESFGIDLFDDGATLRQPLGDPAALIGLEELGNSNDSRPAPRIQREQLPVRAAPAALRLTYYDPERDYLTGEARALASEQSGNDTQRELPAVLTAAAAKLLAQDMLARAWAGRDKLTLRLPPDRLALQPGAGLELPTGPSQWIVDKTIVDGFVVVAELRPSATLAAVVQADGGRIVPNRDDVAGPLCMALIDIPAVLGLSNEPTLLLAASTSSAGWKPRGVTVSFSGQEVSVRTTRNKSLLGTAITTLSTAATELIDEDHDVEIVLIDAEQWLTSCDDDALASGENLAVLGSELIQFGDVTALGGGKFRLGRLLRGRGGTEWACGLHAAGETFCLLRADTLQPVVLPSWAIGATVHVAAIGEPGASTLFLAEALRPPSPVNLTAEQQANGDLLIQWTRRSRLGFAWLDEIDAPLGEVREQYRVEITGTSASVEQYAEQPLATVGAATVAMLGSGLAIIEVRQIGDLAASRPASLTIDLS